jgi:glycosyltransferase involved in cell wall biosynthesis
MIKKNISVAFMNTHEGWGGGEKWHFEAACFFHDLGYKVTFICRKGSVLEKKLIDAGVLCRYFRVSNLSFLNPVKMYSLRSLLQGVEVLIVNSPADNKLAGVTSVFHKSVKVIFRRGMPHPISSSFINRWIFRSRIYRVIANSEAVKASLNFFDEDLIREENIVVIYNGFDVESVENKRSGISLFEEDSIPTLITCGRLVAQKNHLLLLRAAKILNEKNEIFRLVIIGDGPLRDNMEEYISDNDLSEVCYLPGFMENIKGALSESSIFLLPSFYEGSSNALIEACGFGLPAIVSDIPSNRETVSSGVNGFLLPADDPEKWVVGIVELLRDTGKRKQFGLNSQNKIREDFSLSKSREKLKQLIDAAVS